MANLSETEKAKNMLIAGVLHRALGAGPRTKRGANAGGKLISAIAESGDSAAVTGFNASYSDAGLIGAVIAATPCSVEKVS